MFFKDLIKKLKFPKLNAIYISVMALIISIIQLFFSIPFFSNYYFKPNLYLYGRGSDINEEYFKGHFAVFNAGNLKANNVEVGLFIPVNSQVSLMPKIKSRIIREEIQPGSLIRFENIRIEIDSLLPQELLTNSILPASFSDEGEKINKVTEFFIGALRRAGIKKIPRMEFIRSAEGNGKIIESEN